MVNAKNHKHLIKRIILSPVYRFIRDSRSVGISLIACTLISLLLANSFLAGKAYLSFWDFPLHSPIQGLTVPHTLTAFINDVLMAFFFLLMGMEIKREMLTGELSGLKKAALPVFAALGGMVAPALIYFFINKNGAFVHGWGIPMATDIAFSLGILSLLGRRVPTSLKILLTALAIIDDLGAIIAIALFYTAAINILYLIFAVILFLMLISLNLLKVRQLLWYWLLGIALWYCIFNSGVHATVAGVLLAFTLPLNKVPAIEKVLHAPVNFVVLPLFALANTAILIPVNALHAFNDVISYGVVAGLAIGKPAGILLFSFLIVKSGRVSLPKGLQWKHILGMGMVAGIGFTMSVFIAMLAFSEEEARATAKIATLLASLVSGLGGYVYLRSLFKNKPRETARR